MSYWQKLASKLDNKPHPWEQLYADTVSLLDPKLKENLSSKGEFDAFVKVKVSEALDSYQRYLDDDIDPQAAKELALDELMPSDDSEDFTDDDVEDGMEDSMNDLMDYLTKDDDSDDELQVDWKDDEEKPKRMALQVGTTINKNGQQYRLNENHRWTRVEGGGQPAAPKTAQPQQEYQSPQAKQNAKILEKLNTPKAATVSPNQQKLLSQKDFHSKLNAMDKTAVDAMAKEAGIDPTKYPSRFNLQEAIRKSQDQQQSTKLNKTQQQSTTPQQSSDSVFQGSHNPQVESDPNHDGVTDRARVGVAAFDVPPPPKRINRIPGLTGVAKRAESHFADAFEKDADGLTDQAVIMFTAHAEPGKPVVFETDACKNLSPYWKSADLDENMEKRAQNRATLNTSLHQTANAICKRAFVKHLDTLPEGSEILVTVGGCGAGKGYALKNVPQALEMKNRSAVVWDSAGDQNATENPWILQEARKRGLKVNYVFVHADPFNQWANPERGVVKRAQDPNDGRMVDAMVFADSYALGAKNHHAFAEKHKNDGDVRCVYLMNGAQPKLLDTMPPEALKVDRRALAKFAVDYVNGNPDVPEHIRKGATDGTRIWQD